MGSNVVVTFSEAIQRGAGSIVLKTAAGAVVATYNAATSANLSISGSMLTLNPTADLAFGTQHFVEFAAGSMKDLAGNSYAGTSSYDFTTAAAPDVTAPTATGFSPADAATGVAVGSNVVVTFSEPVQRGSGTIVLKTAAGAVVATYNAATSANLGISGSTLTLNPTADLAFGTQYFVEFAAGSIEDLAGNDYAGTSSYDFTTAAAPDVTAPTATGFSPADAAMGVAVGSNVVVTFSEAIQRGTGNIVLKTAAGAVIATYDAATAAQISISGNQLTLNPTANLAFGAQYFVEFAAGSIKDLAGNNYAGTTSYDFTTAAAPDVTAPTATVFSPADAATGVAVGSNVLVTFSEAIQRGSGAIGIWNDSTKAYVETFDAATSANLSISGSTLTINPTANLAFGTQYFVDFAAGSIEDLAGNDFAGIFSYDFTTAAAPDVTAPTATVFSPADAATGVAVGSNVVVTFSEAIQRGAGNIVLKTAAGAVVATYDAATSANLSISGSTLTLNPTADLAFGTQYFVEFAAGSIEDLAGNDYAGTSSYDFTTAAAPQPLSKSDNFVVAQYASPSILGSGPGNDTYLLSPSLLPAGTSLTLTDTEGGNSIQLAAGLSIASSRVAANALQLTLGNGSVITMLGASQFSYEAGGNSSAGLDGPDLGYAAFVQQVLGVTVPTGSAIVTGGALVVGGGAALPAFPAGTKADNFVVAQFASPSILGSGPGNDTYLLSPSLLPAGTTLTLTDTEGSNSVQLAQGLDIASSRVAANALQLTLGNGSVITMLGAAQFTYEAGGNSSAGLDGPDLGYAAFAQQVLGVTVPMGSAIVTGGPMLIGAPPAPGNTGSGAAGLAGEQGSQGASVHADLFAGRTVVGLETEIEAKVGLDAGSDIVAIVLIGAADTAQAGFEIV